MPESATFRSERADFRSERADFRPERADSKLEKADFKPEKVNFWPDGADFRPDRADFKPERAWGTNKGMDKRTKRGPPVFYRTSSPLGPLPKKPQASRLILWRSWD